MVFPGWVEWQPVQTAKAMGADTVCACPADVAMKLAATKPNAFTRMCLFRFLGKGVGRQQLALPPRINAGLEAVCVHDLGPGGNEVLHKVILGVVSGIGFRHGAQFGI